MTQPNYKFTRTARLFHWLTVGALLVQVPLAYAMMARPLGPDKLSIYALHKSIGLTILALTAARLAWRWLRPPPPLPSDMHAAAKALAWLTHAVLYALLLTMPIVGWLSSSAANFPVSLFGLFALPDLVAPDRALHESLETAHKVMAYVLFALVTLHVAAALAHHVVRRDNVLISMLPLARLR